MFDKILHNRWLLLVILFISFILWWLVILNVVLLEKFTFNKDYFYFVHMIVWIWIINILRFIYKENLGNTKNSFIENTFLKFFILWLVIIWLYTLTNLTIISIWILLFITTAIIFFIDSRYSFLIALVFLIYTPFYLILWDKKIAEQLSIYAYYFLIIWVWLEIIYNIFNEKLLKN